MGDISEKAFRNKLLKTKVSSILPIDIDMGLYGSYNSFSCYTDSLRRIVYTMEGRDLIEAIDRYCEGMLVACSESIPDFVAERDLYISIISSKKKVKKGLEY